jgi:hypothetical protein
VSVQTVAGAAARLGVVVIGRNEGERLRRCLLSVRAKTAAVVYVDSGSSDGSAALATSLDVIVHALDMSRPFTAARARNEGLQRLLQAVPGLEFVQFVDGDCEVASGWLEAAVAFIDAHPQMAVVCGRRRERFPERSVYNLLCDLEWDTPIGEAKACGGDALMRTSALAQVGGFRATLIAGEEPELCVRLRAKGWTVWRLDAEMTLHDAAITRIGQWWQRCMRAGFAFAEGVRLHGAPPERHWVRETRSAALWGAVIPLAILFACWPLGALALCALLVYPLQVLRLAMRIPAGSRARWARAFFLVAGKFPEAAGLGKSWLSHWRRRPSTLIEYK